MKTLIEEKGEKLLGKWTINCIPFESGRFLGKLHVSDKSLYYDAEFDMSVKGILDQVMTSTAVSLDHPELVSKSIINQWESKGFLIIGKNEIKNITPKTSFFNKRVEIELIDGNKVIFDYGMLGVKKLVEALKVRT